MNASRSASGSAESLEPDLAGGLGPPDLAPDLVALLLAERREVAVDVDARRAGSTTGQTSSRSTLSVQPFADLARAERGGERVAGGVAAAQAAQVDDVPRCRASRAREVGGDGVGDGRQVGRARVRIVA